MPSITFTSSGSWQSPAATADCQAWGEGGSGADGLQGSSGHSGGGGGGGGYGEETSLALTPGSNYSFTIGSGGTGTNTSFPGDAKTVTGNAGASGSGQSGGAGGAASSNAITFAGGAGGAGASGTGNKGAGGGGGAAGTSGSGGNGGTGGVSGGTGGTAGTGGGTGGAGDAPLGTGGSAGNAPGGGGGGGHKTNTGTGPAGSGANGQITLTWTISVTGTATLSGTGTLAATGVVTTPGSPVIPQQNPGATWLRRFGRYRKMVRPGNQLTTIKGTASLAGTGTLSAFGSAPAPAVVNQWAGGYGQGVTFTSLSSAMQSAVVSLTPAFSVGAGSGVPTPGNWLFAITSWTQNPQIANVHIGVGDDIHSYWREYPASFGGGWSFTTSGTPANGSYFILTTAQAASVQAGNVFYDVNNPGTRFTVSSVSAPFAGFNNVFFTPNAPAVMSSPDVVTQNIGGMTRTAIAYTPNIARTAGNVYVAPDREIAAINVLVVEVNGLGNWDTVVGTNTAYAAAGTSLSLSLGTPGQAAFFIGGTGGDNASSGQSFLPSGWTALAAQTQGNGVNSLADNILTAAFLPSSAVAQSVSGSAVSAENMSGFLLGVLVSGANPIPAGHNPNWPYMIFEAAFGAGFNTPDSEAVWTDISSRLWNWDETTGIQFELGEVQSTDLTMEADNFDGALSPANVNSPYYPNVMPGTPVRIRAAAGTLGGQTANRWYILQRNAAQWGEGIDDTFRRVCPVSGTDLWSALSLTPPTFYRSEIYQDSPYAWWPCDDQPGSAGVLPVKLLNAAIGNTNTLNVQLAPAGGVRQAYLDELGRNTEFGAVTSGFPPGIAVYAAGANAGWMFGDPQGTPASLATGNQVTANPGSAAWQASGQAGNSGSYGWYLICNDNNFPPLSGGVTIECWFNAGFYGSGNGWIYQPNVGAAVAAPITAQPYNSPITLWEIATGSAPVASLQLDASGHLNLIAGGASNSIYASSDLRSNSWHMVTVTLTQTAWQAWLDGGANANVSGSASMASAWTYFAANGDFGSGGGTDLGSLAHGGNISLSHLAVYPHVLPYYRVMDHYWAAVTAFGQLPAPSGVQIAWTNNPVLVGQQEFTYQLAGNLYVPDGSAGNDTSGYDASEGTGVSVIVAATAPGGITSGPSAWQAGVTAYSQKSGEFFASNVWPWISWTGVAPLFKVYTSVNLGSETEAAVVNGNGDAFTGGYGGGAAGSGLAQVSGGDGSVPSQVPSAIGDTVGQRIERLMRGGRCVSTNRCIDPAPLLVQAPGASGSTQAGSGVQAIAQSDSGMLFIDNCNHLTYWQRPHLASQYASPAWSLGPTTSVPGRIPYYPDVQWVTDPQRIYNAIAVSPVSPSGAALPLFTPANAATANASQVRYGAQPLQVASWLQDQAKMQAQANWLLSVFGTPARHIENVKVDAGTYPAAWPFVLGVNVGDIITCEDWVIGGGGAVFTYRVTEIKRHITFGWHGGDTIGSVTLILDAEPNNYWS